jgi:acyl-CoA thioester hydrolase
MNTHTTTLRVRYNECDPMGVAHHTAYPVWFEIGRTELLRASSADSEGYSTIGNYRDLDAQGVFLAVIKLEVRYKRPARYDDLLDLRTTITNVGHVKIEHAYELHREGELIATGATTLACLDGAGRPRELPPFLTARD